MARRDDYMLTPEELRLRRRKRRTILIVGLALVLLIVGVIFGARPARNAIKGWQARRHANKAFAFIEHGEWTEARDEAVAAYQLRPTEPEALRAVARYLSRTRQAEALDFWKQLQDRQLLTREDCRDEAMIALRAGDLERANTAIESLLGNDGKDATPRDWLLAAQLALQRGSPTEAQSALQHVASGNAASPREQLLSALLELHTASQAAGAVDQQRQNEAWQRISKLAEGKDDVSLDALILLAQRILSSPVGGTGAVPSEGKKDDTEVVPPEKIIEALENHPLSQISQKLLALDLQMHADVRAGRADTQRDDLIARAISNWKGAEPNALAALARWLNSKGEYQRVLDTIPLEKALQGRELLLQHLDALGALDRWDDIRKILQSEKYPLDPVIQRMYLARCNAQLGEKTASENNWQRALEAAGNDPGKLLTLADYAEKNGALNIAESAFKLAASASPKLRAAHQGQLRFAQAQRDTKKIHAILSEMLTLWPKDMAIQNDTAYTRLLLGQRSEDRGQRSDVSDQKSDAELKAIVDLAENLVKKNPRSLPHRTLLALALLRQNRAADALAVYENIQVAPNALTPSALAVHAAVLAANGKSDDAQTEVEKIPFDRLLPEERELIHELLGQN